jgi:hypothetical protein
MTSQPVAEEAAMARDPRSDAEKARADLARNTEMGMGVPASPLERQPSVTPETFGDTTEAARVRSGTDQGIEAGGVRPKGGGASEAGSIAESEQVVTGRDDTAPARVPSESGDEDALSRGKE